MFILGVVGFLYQYHSQVISWEDSPQNYFKLFSFIHSPLRFIAGLLTLCLPFVVVFCILGQATISSFIVKLASLLISMHSYFTSGALTKFKLSLLKLQLVQLHVTVYMQHVVSRYCAIEL